MRHTIVGVDPGSTIGIAILDLNGCVLDIFSFRGGINIKDLIKIINSYGKPIIIAMDQKMKSSSIVRQLPYNCKIYYPNKKLNKQEKYKLVKNKLNIKHRMNSHEIDALFAAIKAYGSIRNKILNIEKRCKQRNIEPTEEIFAKVILGSPLII